MGLKKYIPGLKPKSSNNDLVVPVNIAGYPGANYGYYSNPATMGPSKNNASTNIYSIPELGATATATRQQHPTAVRPGTQQPSFEATRSVSSGSGYSNGGGFGSSTNSLGKSSMTSGTSTSTSGFRTFSGASTKSTATSTNTIRALPTDPQVTAADVRRCTKLLRQMFELHLELWTLTYTLGPDQQFRRLEKRHQVEAIMVDIQGIVAGWHDMSPAVWSEEEYAEIEWVVQTLRDLPPLPY